MVKNESVAVTPVTSPIVLGNPSDRNSDRALNKEESHFYYSYDINLTNPSVGCILRSALTSRQEGSPDFSHPSIVIRIQISQHEGSSHGKHFAKT